VADLDNLLMHFQTLLPQILGHIPAGASTMTMLHYLQEVSSGKFQQYNEGTDTANRRRYGTTEPPKYDLSKVRVPIYLHYSHNDYLSAVKVQNHLFQRRRILAKTVFFSRMSNNCLESWHLSRRLRWCKFL
jgi:lysosomal acid lipase/cholesteryl ester hydrolase